MTLSTSSLRQNVEKTKELVESAKSKLDQLLDMWDKALSEIEASEEVRSTMHQSFDSYVNRPLVGNAPVRKVFVRETKVALDRMRNIVDEVGWGVCELILKADTLSRMQRMMQKLARRDVNILARSFLILNLYFEDMILGQYTVRNLLVQNMRQWALIPDACITNPHAEVFYARLAKPVYDTLKLLSLNRNRQRAYIEVVMLPEWDALQAEAGVVDMQVRQDPSAPTAPYFGNFIWSIVVSLMERYVTTGIELGLCYSHEELSFALWYRDLLLSLMVQHMSSMKEIKATERKNAKAAAQKSNKGKKKNRVKASVPEATIEEKEDDLEVAVFSLKRHLCRGMVRFLAAARMSEVVPSVQCEFTSLDRIFTERFQALALVRQPPVMTFQQYSERADFSGVKVEDLLQTAGEWFQACRNSVEQLMSIIGNIDVSFAAIQESEMRDLQKVCIGNSVYIQKLRQVSEAKPPKTSADYDFSAHDQFCILRLS